MSRLAELARRRYDAGLWPEAYVRQLMEAGRITEGEYEEIVGGADAGEKEGEEGAR